MAWVCLSFFLLSLRALERKHLIQQFHAKQARSVIAPYPSFNIKKYKWTLQEKKNNTYNKQINVSWKTTP